MKNAANHREKSVPSVDFYGKDDSWPTAERLHSEPLADRSSRHNWAIRAHRHSNQTQIFLLLDGNGTARLDSVAHRAIAPSIIVIPERCVHEFSWSNDCAGFVLSITSPLIGKLRRKSGRINEVFAKPGVYSLDIEGSELSSMFRKIDAEYSGNDSLRELALETLLIEMAISLVRTADVDEEPVIKAGRGSRHFRRFLELVELHHKSKWSVARYAGRLGITPPHVNAICKMCDGRSAKQVIHDRLLLAARRGLAYSELSIAGVAGSLGFSDPSYFARFFKRFEGVTPSTFRRRTGSRSTDAGGAADDATLTSGDLSSRP